MKTMRVALVKFTLNQAGFCSQLAQEPANAGATLLRLNTQIVEKFGFTCISDRKVLSL